MLTRNHVDRISIGFADHCLVAKAGLILTATLVRHLGLPQLTGRCLGLGRTPARSNKGDKLMTFWHRPA